GGGAGRRARGREGEARAPPAGARGARGDARALPRPRRDPPLAARNAQRDGVPSPAALDRARVRDAEGRRRRTPRRLARRPRADRPPPCRALAARRPPGPAGPLSDAGLPARGAGAVPATTLELPPRD